MITIMIQLDMSINMKKMIDVVSFPKCVTVLRFEVGHFFSFSSGGTSELRPFQIRNLFLISTF